MIRSLTGLGKIKRWFGAALIAAGASASILGSGDNLSYWMNEGAHYGGDYLIHVLDHACHDLTDTSSSVILGDKVDFSEMAEASLRTGTQAVQNPTLAAEKSWDSLKPFSETQSGLFKNQLQNSQSVLGSLETILGFGSKYASAWAQSQGIAGSLDLAELNGNNNNPKALLDSLAQYKINDLQIKGVNGNTSSVSAYSPSGPTGLLGFPRKDQYFYYDDNSWIGLDLIQAYSQTHDSKYLIQAQQLFKFIRTGQEAAGGMNWREQNGTKSQGINTIATGSSSEFALQLYFASQSKTLAEKEQRQEYLNFAEKNMYFLNTHLRNEEGLYEDHQGSDSSAKAIYSYNQGVGLGANALLAKAYYQKYQEDPAKNTEDLAKAENYLALANQTATASIKYFSQTVGLKKTEEETRLWKQPPAFNAIYFRNLLALGRTVQQVGKTIPDLSKEVNTAEQNSKNGGALLKNYLQAAWNLARDPKTGLFDRDGIGHYGGSSPDYLDQSAFVQMYSLLGISGQNLYRSM